ncbi:type VI secretion system baseplate subunit TssE [Tropicimonas sp. IMCC34011]|uniref:type VI secretion system baseplate subunit TssE n=1 Tax=Tropicimonas sp. IMCC34011 TaxID=2248759 RepID=UPI000E2414BD|nr:GPW/gp25 family protein [Tropicimonas sp. IMCC34011]
MADLSRQPLQVPLMYAFREAFEAKDAKKGEHEYRDGARVLSDRGATRRRGANEAQLKADLEIDLNKLANTINLAAAEDLSPFPFVRRSILNYGVVDLSLVSEHGEAVRALTRDLREALLANEPRFISRTMEIRLHEAVDDVDQKFIFDISAEMACRPVDIPLEFVAEIDVGSGKIAFNRIGGAK